MMITAHCMAHTGTGGCGRSRCWWRFICPFSTRKPPRFGVVFPTQQLNCELLRAIYSAGVWVCVCVRLWWCLRENGQVQRVLSDRNTIRTRHRVGKEPWLENMPTLPSSEWKPPSDTTAPNGGEINQQKLQLHLRLLVDTPTSPIVHRCLPLALLNRLETLITRLECHVIFDNNN